MSLDTVLLVAGVVLIGLEIVVPGGILGAIGLLSLTAGFFFFLGGGWDAFCIVGGTVAVLAAICALLFWFIPSSSSWNPFVLQGYNINLPVLLCCAKSRKTAKVIPARQIIHVI